MHLTLTPYLLLYAFAIRGESIILIAYVAILRNCLLIAIEITLTVAPLACVELADGQAQVKHLLTFRETQQGPMGSQEIGNNGDNGNNKNDDHK